MVPPTTSPGLAFPALGDATAATSRALNRGVGLSSGVELSVDPQAANVTTRFGVSGVLTLVGIFAALWALDRYVVDVPGIGRGS